jgi:hypothetical protein
MVNCGRTLDAHARPIELRYRAIEVQMKEVADYTEQRFHHPRPK